MHPVATPYPSTRPAAIVYYDDEAVCFHVYYPWKPQHYGQTIGYIESQPPLNRGAIHGIDTLEEVQAVVSDIEFNLTPPAEEEAMRRHQLYLFRTSDAEMP